MRDFLQMELNSQRGVGRGLNWIKPNLEYISDQSNILIDLSWWQSNGFPKCYTLIKVCSFSRRCICAFYFLLRLGSVYVCKMLSSQIFSELFCNWVFSSPRLRMSSFLNGFLLTRVSSLPLKRRWQIFQAQDIWKVLRFHWREKRKSLFEGRPFGWFMLPLGKSFVPLIWQLLLYKVGDNPK